MDMKISQMLQAQQVEQTKQAQPTDGSFKFTLVTQIEESQLQQRLTAMMEQITMQGEKLAKHRDVKDMKRRRFLPHPRRGTVPELGRRERGCRIHPESAPGWPPCHRWRLLAARCG